ncbi:MAG TPA: hypothetical protein VL988_06120 [Solirubrobacteraceae bacterium]|nr:hypothetical protein [Solirubrobacteraceae bacterium]
MPFERVQSELFNAGHDWQAALAEPAIATFAAAIFEAHATLAERLRASERPEQAIQQVLSSAREAATAEPPSAAAALAERAFVAMLTRTAAGDTALAALDGAAAAERFSAARGSPDRFLSGYLGELLGQYARHVTAREVGRLTEGERAMSVRQTRALTRELAAAATEIGRATEVSAGSADAVRAAWSEAVSGAFVRGARLPEARA